MDRNRVQRATEQRGEDGKREERRDVEAVRVRKRVGWATSRCDGIAVNRRAVEGNEAASGRKRLKRTAHLCFKADRSQPLTRRSSRSMLGQCRVPLIVRCRVVTTR